jgi:hypothetical protein
MHGQPDILPDARLKTVLTPKGVKMMGSVAWVPIYCVNCGADGGRVPEENMTDVFYLCDPCFEVHGKIAGTMVMRDEVFFARVRDEQLAKYGRDLTPFEQAVQLTDPDSFLSKLARARAALTPSL